MARRTTRSTRPAAAPPSRPPAGRLPAIALVLLGIAFAASALLVRKHFGGSLPGCGERSACDALEAGPWGKLPVIGWPTSFLGLTWFAALLVACVVARGGASAPLLWIARAGALGSAWLSGVMLVEGKLCPWCAAVHVANIAFVIVLEIASRRGARGVGPASHALLAGLVAFATLTAGLALAERRHAAARAAGAGREAAALVEAASAGTAGGSQGEDDPWGPGGFTGRHRLGPDPAIVRIVMFTDYQCPDCKRFEGEVFSLLERHPEVSLAVKHFPMCSDCNPAVPRTLHPNACWAARAAEAAGILGGDDAFFRMHRWLFEVDGRFERTEELDAGIRQAGLDPVRFREVMHGPEALRGVQEDAAQAIALGLHYTPMIFINGVELKWTQDAAASVSLAVEGLLTRGLAPAPASSDRPPLAARKYVEDWRDQPRLTLAQDSPSWSQLLGPASAQPVEVVMFGDLASPHAVEMEADIRAAVDASGVSVRYSYRHYPLERSCNAALPPNMAANLVNANACRMARAAEAAGRLGGGRAYWEMHAWLLASRASFTEEGVRAEAARLGFDAAELAAAMDAPESAAAIANDCEAARLIGLRSVPSLYVASRRVPRTKLENASILRDILETAAAEPR